MQKGRRGGGGEKNGRKSLGRREGSACNQSLHTCNSMLLRSKSGYKMLIGHDMSYEAVSYILAVRLSSVCFKITIIKTLVCQLEYAITSLICKLGDLFSLKWQIDNIQLGQEHGIFHGCITRTGETIKFRN